MISETCPKCGNNLPDVENVKFCMKCGLNLFNDVEINKSRLKSEIELWGFKSSIILPILAFSVMQLMGIAISFIIFAITLDLSYISSLASNAIFIAVSSLLEFIFIIIPVLFVGRYLQNPTLKNRLRILGFTWRGYKTKDLLKEFGIGILFAFLGIGLVFLVSFIMELCLPPVQVSNPFSSLDIYGLLLLIFVMIFVVGPTEEVIFRGFMQKGLVRSELGEKTGIFLTAIIFTLIHLIQYILQLIFGQILLDTFIIIFIALFFPYLSISLLLGLLFRWRDENLIAVIITHGLYDALTLVLIFFVTTA